MNGDKHVIYIHGVGRQDKGFSAFAQKRMRKSLRNRGLTHHGQEVLWAPVLDDLQDRMLADVKKLGSKGNLTQQLVIGTLSDALNYHNRKEQIFALIDVAIARLRSDSVHICAHSLGVVLALEYLMSRTSVAATMTSFGTNAQLFQIGARASCPLTLKGPNRWRNAFYEADMLGFPVSSWMPQVKDYKLSKPFWSISTIVPGLSHNDYWKDSDFWSRFVPAGF